MTDRDALIHFGFAVDLSVAQGADYLKEAEIKVEDVSGAYSGPKIKWQDEWINLCRTDLKDDVATGLVATKTVEEWRDFYLKHVGYGVRIRRTSRGGKSFACIDSFSDG